MSPSPPARQEQAQRPAEPQAAPEAGPAREPKPPTMYAEAVVRPIAAHVRVEHEKRAWYESAPRTTHGLTEFQRTAFRVFGGIYNKRPVDPRVAESLAKARAGLRAEALQSTALLSGIMGAVMGAVVTLVMLAVVLPAAGMELSLPLLLVFGLMPAFMGLGGYMAIAAGPKARAKARARDIDMRLPYALNYIAAMASAGVNVDTIFKSLAEQKIYGEVAREAEAIYRDISLFGRDVVTAFKRAIARTPSQRFAELLQGAITTFGSGGDLQAYFSSKAQRYMVENRQEQKAFLDTMGLMAETYVTTAVAGPLFLMVMMAIMGMLSGGGPGQLYLIVYLLLPVANFGFVYGLMAMTPKV